MSKQAIPEFSRDALIKLSTEELYEIKDEQQREIDEIQDLQDNYRAEKEMGFPHTMEESAIRWYKRAAIAKQHRNSNIKRISGILRSRARRKHAELFKARDKNRYFVEAAKEVLSHEGIVEIYRVAKKMRKSDEKKKDCL